MRTGRAFVLLLMVIVTMGLFAQSASAVTLSTRINSNTLSVLKVVPTAVQIKSSGTSSWYNSALNKWYVIGVKQNGAVSVDSTFKGYCSTHKRLEKLKSGSGTDSNFAGGKYENTIVITRYVVKGKAYVKTIDGGLASSVCASNRVASRNSTFVSSPYKDSGRVSIY